MISKEELREYKKIKGLSFGQIEKDYLLELSLMVLTQVTKNELIFKGGTCLYKFHGINRFSEDLDFSATADLDKDSLFERLINGLEKYGVKGKIKSSREPFQTILATLSLQGPLYDGIPRSAAKIRVDVNLKSAVLLPPVNKTLYSEYREITPFQVLCMDEAEIEAEKIRAIISRDKARDVYDLWFLIKKGIIPPANLIEAKMLYYEKAFCMKTFISRLNDKEDEWVDDLSKLIFGQLPKFDDVKKEITAAIK